tara:strand:- start:742 stop:1032 length:291 start_codon:yes stop_codon:yes gene_type:complete
MEFIGAGIFIAYSIFTAIQLERQRKELNIDRRSVHKQLNEQLKLDKEIATELKLQEGKKFDITPYMPLIQQFLGKKADMKDLEAIQSELSKIDGGK